MGIILDILTVAGGIYVIYIAYKVFSAIHRKEMSFRETMDLCNMPIITFINNGYKVNFILDTGSSKSVIDKSVLDKLSYKDIEGTGIIYGMDGKKNTVSFVEMSIEYKNKSYTDNFQVCDMSVPFSNLKADYGVNVHGILSSTFFQKYKYILNFDELIAYSK